MTAEAFTKLCLFMGHPNEDIVTELQKDPFDLSMHEAQDLVQTTVRASQEVEIENAHDDLEDAHA